MVNGQSTFDLKQAIDDKKVILFNLSKGSIGDEASEALGRFIIANIKGIAMRRASLDEEKRVPVHLYIDECQNFIGPSIHTILTETRKYKLHLTMAQQVAGDGMGPDLKQIVFNNVQVNFAGLVKKDSNLPQILNVGIDDLQRLGIGEFYCRIGTGSTLMMKAYSYLTFDENQFSSDDYQKFMQAQLQYYRPIGEARVDSNVVAAASTPQSSYTPDLV